MRPHTIRDDPSGGTWQRHGLCAQLVAIIPSLVSLLLVCANALAHGAAPHQSNTYSTSATASAPGTSGKSRSPGSSSSPAPRDQPGPTAGDYANRSEVRAFARDLALRHGWEDQRIVDLLSNAERQSGVLAIIARERRTEPSWRDYRAALVSNRRITEGVQFVQLNRATLQRAAERFQVPASVIAAIIGVETEYGRNTGQHRVLDTLVTLGFDEPRRGEFFRDELEQLLVYALSDPIDLRALRGSYAGAIGIAQFMPSSIQKWGIDFDEDGRRDLVASTTDAIGSVANYLREHGWQAGAPIVLPANARGLRYKSLAARGIEPQIAAAELAEFDVRPAQPLSPNAKVALIELNSPGHPAELRLGMDNFYVITRYNRSSFYAMAVIDLAAAIERLADLRPEQTRVAPAPTTGLPPAQRDSVVRR